MNLFIVTFISQHYFSILHESLEHLTINNKTFPFFEGNVQ